jgi:hypothetical protein
MYSIKLSVEMLETVTYMVTSGLSDGFFSDQKSFLFRRTLEWKNVVIYVF